METSLIINSTDTQGNKVQRTISKVNPEVSSAVATEFAQRVTALSTNTYTGGKRINVADISDSAGAMIAKTAPTLTLGEWSANGTTYTVAITYNGDGTLATSTGTISNGTLTVNDSDGNFSGTVSAAEGENYAAASLNFNHAKETAPTKTEPTLELSGGFSMYYDGVYQFGDYDGNPANATSTITYNGDGALFIGNYHPAMYRDDQYDGVNQYARLVGNTLYVKSDAYKNWFFDIYASEGTDYAAKTIHCEVQTED